jgi:hypothetical protein
MKGEYLITTDNWFYAPDGKQYNGVWGNTEIVQDSFLGIKTNARSANWYAKVGTDENHIIIAGCQIHYAIKCKEPDTSKPVEDYTIEAGKCSQYTRPNRIYKAI